MLYCDLPGRHTRQCVSVKVVLISSILCTPSPQRSLTVTSLTFCFQSTNTSEKHKGTDSHIDVKTREGTWKKCTSLSTMIIRMHSKITGLSKADTPEFLKDQIGKKELNSIWQIGTLRMKKKKKGKKCTKYNGRMPLKGFKYDQWWTYCISATKREYRHI